jgi:DNA-binding transcriptional MerR regulator
MTRSDARFRPIGGWGAARVVGVPYRTLDGWIRSGLLPQPEVPAQGKGTRRRFSFLDLIRAAAVQRLRSEGIRVHTIRKAVDALGQRYYVTDPLNDTARLVVAGDRLFWAMDDRTLLDILTGQLSARPLVLLDVAELIARTRARMHKMEEVA